MRKWLYVALIAVILAILSVAYYITGVRAEKEFERFLESAENFPNVTVTADHYQRGWIKSTVHINAVLHQPAQQYTQDDEIKTLPAQDISFSFNTDIYHGPIIVENNHVSLGLGYAQAEIPLPNEVLSQFDNLFTADSIKPTFVVSLLLKYRDRLDVGFDVPAFELTSKDKQAQINWKGFESLWKLTAKLSRTRGHVKFNGATFKNHEAHGEMGSMYLKYDLEDTTSQILSGNASLNLQSVLFSPAGGSSLVVHGFQAATINHVHDGLVSSSLKADVSDLSFHGVDYGPGVLNVSATNLDAKALNQIQEQLQAVNGSDLSDAQQQVLLLTILPELPRLLGKGATFEVKQFQVSVPEGLILATADIKLPHQEKSDPNPLQLLNQLQANANVEVPVLWLNNMAIDLLKFKIEQNQLMQKEIIVKNEADAVATGQKASSTEAIAKLLTSQEIDILAVQQAKEQLNKLVENGVLIKKDNIYSIKLTFKQGSLMVNGKPFNGNMIQ